MSERGSEEGTTEPERASAPEPTPIEGEDEPPELVEDELDSDEFDSDSADPPRQSPLTGRAARPSQELPPELIDDESDDEEPKPQSQRPRQERLVRSSPRGNQLVRESDLRQQQNIKESLEWGTPTSGFSKKATREWENEQALGGLRNPWIAVAKNTGLKWLGSRVRRAFDRLLVKFPQEPGQLLPAPLRRRFDQRGPALPGHFHRFL